MVPQELAKESVTQAEQVGISEAVLAPSCPNQLRAAPAHRVTSSPSACFLVLVDCPHSGMQTQMEPVCQLFSHIQGLQLTEVCFNRFAERR